ncbi:hypothetical protein V12B01_13000 [Vibrio splendidus 12B01]|nr:hypothetical protein V12B01_13000 [Vibrio splendidus 12B01]
MWIKLNILSLNSSMSLCRIED